METKHVRSIIQGEGLWNEVEVLDGDTRGRIPVSDLVISVRTGMLTMAEFKETAASTTWTRVPCTIERGDG